MSALSRVVRSGVSRRWVQTVVIMLATAAAVTAGVLGIGLLVASNAPFDHAFAAQHGAHLAVLTDPAKATAAQLAASWPRPDRRRPDGSGNRCRPGDPGRGTLAGEAR